MTVKSILSEYERISCQKINYNKSGICLSKNICSGESISIWNSLNVNKVQYHGNYLGLPFVYGSNKSEAFQSLMKKCNRCSANWCNKVLSAAGKEVLIKSVLQALPTYMMSVSGFLYQFLKKFKRRY